MASEAESAPISSPYTLHAAASVAGSGLATNALDVPASPAIDQDFSTPVAAHSSATVTSTTPDPVEAPADADEKAPVLSLAQLVDEHSSTEVPDSEAECLARAVYFESKGEPLAGQLAVAEVVINRARIGPLPHVDLRRRQAARASSPSCSGGRLPAVAARLARTGAPRSRSRRSRCRISPTARCRRRSSSTPARLAGLAPDPRRHRRQPRLLPLIASTDADTGPVSQWEAGLFVSGTSFFCSRFILFRNDGD